MAKVATWQASLPRAWAPPEFYPPTFTYHAKSGDKLQITGEAYRSLFPGKPVSPVIVEFAGWWLEANTPNFEALGCHIFPPAASILCAADDDGDEETIHKFLCTVREDWKFLMLPIGTKQARDDGRMETNTDTNTVTNDETHWSLVVVNRTRVAFMDMEGALLSSAVLISTSRTHTPNHSSNDDKKDWRHRELANRFLRRVVRYFNLQLSPPVLLPPKIQQRVNKDLAKFIRLYRAADLDELAQSDFRDSDVVLKSMRWIIRRILRKGDKVGTTLAPTQADLDAMGDERSHLLLLLDKAREEEGSMTPTQASVSGSPAACEMEMASIAAMLEAKT